MAADLVGKQLGVLKEIVPPVSRLAVLRQPGNPASAAQLREAEAAARALGIRLQTFEARNPKEIDSALAAMTREGAGALVLSSKDRWWSWRIACSSSHRLHLHESARTDRRARSGERLPAVFGNSEPVVAGGLVGYSASVLDLERRAAAFVDKILKGARPGDLPIEQPTKFDLVVNLKTAKALGLTIPQSMLLRADHVIE
jgi:putative tryptophan/tyrosine transport system substrate-binding protein